MMYHVKTTFATMARILRQLSHDHRTIALIFVVPCVLLALLRWMFDDNTAQFNAVAPAMLAVFPFTIMFIITSITTLRERTGGTMERLMTTRIAKLDLVMGYMLAFGLLAAIQAAIASLVLLGWLGLDISGPEWFLIVVALCNALLGTALGIFVSAFARTEFQAIQFMPAFVAPQILIGGLIMPVDKLPDLLQSIANVLPLTYAISALNEVARHTDITSDAVNDVLVVVGFMIAAIILAALTLRRRTK